MIQKKVELLAPAGDFTCFQAAINAGADAVYLGGDKFGARAYAQNFSQEEIIEALRIAHLFNKKIYLTVNTLVKEKEIDSLIPYLTPLYEAGLDGIIVQDIGVLEIARTHFPGLELHASTQMAVTGVYGAAFLKELGVCRVVPARELSIEEIQDIKAQTGLAIETFIHGAMCYAYSGQCLFSSILGGRSGNRGRCAGPCRLPYQDERGKTIYPLSLKDMYTLPIIPKLIKAGIDSFKIEGRMKSPEYVAGVTAMYRKYIDTFLNSPDKPYRIKPQDEALIRGLYIRTDTCTGFYEQHNGKNMVTIKEAGYSGNDEKIIAEIQQKYLSHKKTIPVQGYVKIRAGEDSVLSLYADGIKVTVTGDVAGNAINRPLTQEDIRNRVCKMGDTYFELEKLEIDTDNCSFLPVKALNELRRQACNQLEDALLGRTASKPAQNVLSDRKDDGIIQKMHKSITIQFPDSSVVGQLYVLATTLEQFQTVLHYPTVKGIYISADLFLDHEKALLLSASMHTRKDIPFFLALPHIMRKRSYSYLPIYKELLENGNFQGVLVRNHEELQWLHEIGYSGQCVSDYSLYTWNRESACFYDKFFSRLTMPVELNKKELEQLLNTVSNHMDRREICIYGRLPLMYSANCIRKTLDNCIMNMPQKSHLFDLTDRYRNHFTVAQNCYHCYNILYNTVPLSLHGQINSLLQKSFGVYRLDFTLENAEETSSILDFYSHIWNQEELLPFPCRDFTNGHYKRGVE